MSISWAARRTRLLLIVFAALAVAGSLAAISHAASARPGGLHAFRWGGGPECRLRAHGAAEEV